MAAPSAAEGAGEPEAAPLLAQLNEQQRAAAGRLVGPLRILAGAGTGKTRTITHRIAYGIRQGVYDPKRVLALTFTSRAAGEMRSRLAALGVPAVPARTFHAAALSQLGHFWPHTVGGTAPAVLPGKARLLAEAAESLGLALSPAALRETAGEIEWRKTGGLGIERYAEALAAGRPLSAELSAERAVALHERYETLKDERRAMDFEDVLLATSGMLQREPWVAQRVREQYRFFVVDEYQDVSPLQHELLRLWLGERRDLCVVGDPAQTIYSFTGASGRFLLDFEREFPGARTVRLERNYRSRRPVIELANRVAEGIAGSLRLEAAAEAGRPPRPELVEHPDDEAEARAVAAAIAADLRTGADPGGQAVLFRTNAQAARLERALQEAGVPYRSLGAGRFFEQPDVRLAVSALRGEALGGGDGAPLFQSVGRVLRGLGWTQRQPERPGAELERWRALEAIARLADEQPRGTTLAAFAAELQRRARYQIEPELRLVALASLHSAKGLEWESVSLVGCSDDLVPFALARGPEEIEEERRLLYVGVTRARSRLRLSWAGLDGRGGRRAPSRFLTGLGPRVLRTLRAGQAGQAG
ncbi:MAG: ATP-dependent helicase, partial [Pseudoclavibacter sp.]|nr:ATP-dependent helicase [Pseudoclavibacter sp.]